MRGGLFQPPAPADSAKGAAPPDAGVHPTSSSVPEIPAPTTSVSQAALAAGAGQTLDPNASFGGGTPGVLLSQPRSPASQPPAPNPTDECPVVLTDQVIPLSSNQPPATASAAPPPSEFESAGPPPHLQSFTQVDDALQARHVVSHDLTESPPGSNVWQIVCHVQSPTDPAKVIEFKAVAPGEGGLAAIRAVLAQIDQYPVH